MKKVKCDVSHNETFRHGCRRPGCSLTEYANSKKNYADVRFYCEGQTPLSAHFYSLKIINYSVG